MKSRQARLFTSYLFLFFMSGIIIFQILWVLLTPASSALAQHLGEFMEITGSVFEDPDISETDTKIHLQTPYGAVSATLSHTKEISRDDIVTIYGQLSEGKGLFASYMFRPKLVSIDKPNPPNPFLVLRDWMSTQIRNFIPPPASDLALGYLLGTKSSLPVSLSEALVFTGLVHIIVASGGHLSTIISTARTMFGKVSRLATLLASLILLISFICITGISPSMLRAGIITLITLTTWYFGREIHPLSTLLIAGAITLTINPYYILSLGWMLSFASFAGLLIISPLLIHFLYGDEKPNFIAETIIATTSAQLACLPVSLYYFGTFPLLAIIPNVIILPTLPAVMGLTFLTGIFSWLQPLATVFGWITNLILQFHLKIIDFFGALSWSAISVETNNLPILIVSTITIILAIILLKFITKHRFWQPFFITDATPILR